MPGEMKDLQFVRMNEMPGIAALLLKQKRSTPCLLCGKKKKIRAFGTYISKNLHLFLTREDGTVFDSGGPGNLGVLFYLCAKHQFDASVAMEKIRQRFQAAVSLLPPSSDSVQ